LKQLLIALCVIILPGSISAAAEKPNPPEMVSPAAYRIMVKYDQQTIDSIQRQINREVRKYVDERIRRLNLSEEELKHALRDEIARSRHPEKYRDELAAIDKAEREEQAARARSDNEEAEAWRRLRIERTLDTLDLARQANAIEEALRALSVDNWRASRRQQRIIAEKALVRLDAMLKQVEAGRTAR